ncbi:ABC transporter family substrate-binding protein [Ruania halotolerans]|uniref:ABC transporter family substrate-binding protein n=1 Tax=Ruania halotolerans TaxID=2897773 RepID=UPI001E2B9015|nr:ABC transporter family substrate-binding protein [Ruania halotolerans]UFU07487.1 ABC transporter family substrate-binding protein [Ruania halotolerans]
MKIRRITAVAATMAAGALVLSACETPETDGGSAGIDEGTALNIGWNQSFYEYNDDSATGNATANAMVLYLMKSDFNYYDEDLNLVQDTSFGSYEKTSDDPLTVEYTFNDDAAWSDGTPVDAADLVLYWAALSGNFNTEEFASDDEGVTVYPEDHEEAGEPVPEDVLNNQVFFNFTSPNVGLIDDMAVSEDHKQVTVTYAEPFVDWEVNLGVGVPAHVVAQNALDIEDPTEAKQALLDAVANEDAAALAPISNFWNTGFQFGDTLPEDESLYLSSGAYLMTDFRRDQSVTLEANPDYTGDHQASIETITIRYNEDPMASVQALQNGEIDLIQPQASADTLQALEALGDEFAVITGDGATYEHVDLAFANGGPFDPATYDGDEDTALAVRQAFLKLIPRQDIVDRIISPLNPEASVRSAYTAIPGAPNYGPITEVNGMDEMFPLELDREGAAQLLDDAGVETPIEVRLLTAADNTRRQDQLALITESVEADGLFEIVDASSAEWGSLLADPSGYDASMFGWQSTSTAVAESRANFETGGGNNFGAFSDPRVDELYTELVVTTDPDRQAEILGEVEAILVESAFGVTIYQHPAITGYNAELQNVSSIQVSPTMFWNFWEWETTLTGDEAAEDGDS